MCLILVVVMFGLSVQSFLHGDTMSGTLYLLTASAFAFLLIRNIRQTICDRNAGCNTACMLPQWMTNFFIKSDKS